MSSKKQPNAKRQHVPGGPVDSDPFKWSGNFFTEHPIRDPVIILVLCVLALLILNSGALQASVPGQERSAELTRQVNGACAGLGTLVLLFTFITGVFLLINITRLSLRRALYRPKVCPHCGTVEAP